MSLARQRPPAELYEEPATPGGDRYHFEVRRVQSRGEIGWLRLFISEVLMGEPVGLEEVDDGVWSLYFGPRLLARCGLREVRRPARTRVSDEGPCRTEEGYGNCRVCRRMWKARGKRGRAFGRSRRSSRRPPTTALENPEDRVSHSRLESWAEDGPPSHSSHSPDDDDFSRRPLRGKRRRRRTRFAGRRPASREEDRFAGKRGTCNPCTRSVVLPIFPVVQHRAATRAHGGPTSRRRALRSREPKQARKTSAGAAWLKAHTDETPSGATHRAATRHEPRDTRRKPGDTLRARAATRHEPIHRAATERISSSGW